MDFTACLTHQPNWETFQGKGGKRPLTAYQLFIQEGMEKFKREAADAKKEHPGKGTKGKRVSALTVCAQHWKAVSHRTSYTTCLPVPPTRLNDSSFTSVPPFQLSEKDKGKWQERAQRG